MAATKIQAQFRGRAARRIGLVITVTTLHTLFGNVA